MKAVLIPLDGENPIPIQKDLVVIGRQTSCDLQIDHQTVSKLHCVLVKTDGLLLLRDLGSTNGTFVNGQKVKRAALLPNDVLSLAAFRYKVFLGADDAPVPSVQVRSDRTEMIANAELNRPAGAPGLLLKEPPVVKPMGKAPLSLTDLPYNS